MRSDQQLDVFQHSPQRLAAAHREQAAMWLVNPYYAQAERQRRHDNDIKQAERLERSAEAQNG